MNNNNETHYKLADAILHYLLTNANDAEKQIIDDMLNRTLTGNERDNMVKMLSGVIERCYGYNINS